MGSGGPIVLAVRDPGGHAERVIYDLQRWAEANPLVTVEDRRHGRELEGLIVVTGTGLNLEPIVAGALSVIDPDWALCLERLELDAGETDTLLAHH